jgi:glycosyltransferase involved in cell wall biosynthesis
MNVCLIFQGEFPREERIEKTAKSLAANGNTVYLLCNNYGTYSAREEVFGDVHVVRIGPVFKNRTVNRIMKFPVFLNPLWIWSLFRATRKFEIDVLQVIDLPVSPAVLAVGRIYHLPVLYDMWENYPEALRGWARRDWKYLVFKNYSLARAVEKWVTKRVDHIFTVVEEARQRLIADGVNPSRVSVVTNGVDLELFLKTSASVGVSFDPDPDAYKLFYVGDITVERGLDDIVRALTLVRNVVPLVHLYIAGTGKDLPRLKTIAETEGVSDLVTWLGFLPFDQIHSYVIKSDLCLVPHVYNDFINTTIPNKLFQYMVLRRPVLVSNAQPLARIVGQCGCGFIFKSGSREDAAAKIIAAHQTRDDDSYGERGKVCVEQYYTWEIASRELLRVYRGLTPEAQEEQMPATAHDALRMRGAEQTDIGPRIHEGDCSG